MFKSLVKDTLRLLRENYSSEETILVSSPGSHLFFSPSTAKAIPHAKNVTIKIEKTEKPSHDSFDDLRSILKKTAPNFALQSHPPSDQAAKKAQNDWQEKPLNESLAILIFEKSEENVTFYKNLAKAIDTHLLPTKLIFAARFEKENAWSAFFKDSPPKWILAEEEAIRKCTQGMEFFQDNGHEARFFGPSRFFSLQPPETYMKNLALKKDLWETLCRTLRSP